MHEFMPVYHARNKLFPLRQLALSLSFSSFFFLCLSQTRSSTGIAASFLETMDVTLPDCCILCIILLLHARTQTQTLDDFFSLQVFQSNSKTLVKVCSHIGLDVCSLPDIIFEDYILRSVIQIKKIKQLI